MQWWLLVLFEDALFWDFLLFLYIFLLLILLLEKHRNEKPDFNSTRNGIPSSLIALNERMLAKNPDDRPSASEVAIELKRIADTLLNYQPTIPLAS